MRAALALVAALLAPSLAEGRCEVRPAWPHYAAYTRHFVSDDGRVIDRTDGDRSTSEGQAYGLVLALIANDPERFGRILEWTVANLSSGRLDRNLPAWLWGQDGRGRWRVLDENAASDADLWMAYALLEAGRLWDEPRYTELAVGLAGRIVELEVRDVDGLGPMLLPGPKGFVLKKGRLWRLNPSYLPVQVMRRLAHAGLEGPWAEVAEASVRLLLAAAPRGIAPDWILWDAKRGAGVDRKAGSRAAYDAIRTSLWAGMLPHDDPARRELTRALSGLLLWFEEDGALPETIDIVTEQPSGSAPVGFYAALMPLAGSRPGALRDLREAVEARRAGALFGSPPTYYDQNLVLFGLGYAEGRFRFDPEGRLQPSWVKSCSSD
jgi:endoglucanase